MLAVLAAPAAAAPAAVEIVVKTTADTVNGDVMTVARLLASPGPDGISLREAIHATNNDPGSSTIRFAPALAGATITLESELPPLTGGGVVVEGDIDGNRKPDVTLRPRPRPSLGWPWVALQPYWPHWLPDPGELPSHRTFADNVVSDLVIRGGVGTSGIGISSVASPECDHLRSPCPTYNRWTNTAFTGNTIEVGQFAFIVGLNASIGDRVEGLSMTDNTIRHGTSAAPAKGGAAIQLSSGGSSTQTRMSDVLIARNAIDRVNGDGGLFVGAGMQRAQANTIDGVRVIDNRIHLVRQGSVTCCFAIVLNAGSETWAVDVRPVKYPSGNILRDVRVTGNSVNGSLAAGVRIQAGVDAGGSRNRVENVRVERNVIRSTTMGKGIYLWAGDILPFEGTFATGNRIAGVAINANRITTGGGKPPKGETSKQSAGGVVLVGGWHYSRGGMVRDVRITNNQIVSAQAAIRLIGGIGPTARGNRVSCVRLARNRGTGTRTVVSVRPNVDERRGDGPTPGRASGNRASLGRC